MGNQIKDIQINKLESLGIYQLRNIARQVGVQLPTTLKKADLISNIVAIVNGEKQPQFRKDKKGRPAKYPADASLLNSITDVREENSFSVLQKFQTIPYPTLASYEAMKLQELKDVPTEQKQGYVFIGENGYALFLEVPQKSNKPFYIKKQMVQDYNLKDGDKVEVNIYALSDAEPIVSGIVSVNGTEIGKKTQFYDIFACEKIKNSNNILWQKDNVLDKFYSEFMPAYCGDKILVDIPQKELLYACNLDFVKRLSQSENITDIVVLGVNCLEEAISQIGELPKVSLIAGGFGDDGEYQKCLVKTSFKNALNLASIKGKNVAFVVLDFEQMINVFEGQEQKDFLNYAKKVFSLARQTEHSSLTVCYSFAQNEQMLNSFVPNQNILLQYLPLNLLTNSQIKYNLSNSFRQEVFSFESSALQLRQAVQNFLNKNKNDYSLLEKAIQKNTQISQFISEIQA